MTRQPLPVPRLLAARLEPARDPEPDLGRAEARTSSRGRCSASRPTRARKIEQTLWDAAGRRARLRELERVRRAARAALRRCRRARREHDRRSPAGAEPRPRVRTPYVGLVPTARTTRRSSSGASARCAIVAANLRASRLTLLYGPSGVGKSSLLLAGVVHDLREEVARARDGPSTGAVRRLRRSARGATTRCRRSMEAVAGGASRRSAARELPPWRAGEPLVETAARPGPSASRTLLIVLDQFEEYFLYHADEDGERRRSRPSSRGSSTSRPARELPALAPRGRLGEARPLRGAHPGAVRQLPARRPPRPRRRARGDRGADRASGTERLPPGEQPYAIEPALVEAVLDGRGRRGCAHGEAPSGAGREARGERIEAPFLQLVLERLWRDDASQPASHSSTLRGSRRSAARSGSSRTTSLDALGRLAARRAGRRGRPSSASSSRRSKTKIAHPAADLADWTRRPEPEVDGGAREALPRRERPHPARRRAARRTTTGATLRALPRRARRADPRLADAATSSASAQPAGASARRRGSAHRCGPARARRRVRRRSRPLGARSRAAMPRARRASASVGRASVGLERPARHAARRVAAPEPGGRPGARRPRRQEAA